MQDNDEQGLRLIETWAFPILLMAISVALGYILLPFYGILLWSTVIALLFVPLHEWLLVRMPGRLTLAALLTLLVVVVIVVIPLVLISGAISSEVMGFYQRIESGDLVPEQFFLRVLSALPDWLTQQLDRMGMVDYATSQKRLTAELAEASQAISARTLRIGQSTFAFVASFFITLYLAFYFIRDGEVLARSVRHAIPLQAAMKRELFDKFATVIRATVKGNLVVAAIQGLLGGLAFWVLDVRAALLWAVLMAFLSLLPAVGAALVWLPVALYFLATGALWQGLALIAWGVLVIGLVDNLLRPVLVGRDTQMPDYVVMMTTLGGMAVFGINGFVLGPVIAALFIAVWHLYGVMRKASVP